MGVESLIGAGTSIIGGMMGSDAAESAANTQAQSAANATALQREIFDKQVALQEPFRNTGVAANNRLALLMGLTPEPSTGGAGGYGGMTYEQLRRELAPQYTTTSTSPSVQSGGMGFSAFGGGASDSNYSPPTQTTTVNENALQAAINQRLEQQRQQQATAQTTAQSDPAFGSLTRSFTNADFVKDPGYDFRLSEGMRGVESGAAARGGLLSGAAIKALNRYGQGFASDEFGKAYDRFNNNNTLQFNRLSSLSGGGQTASGAIGQAGQNYATQAGNNMIGAGNTQAAGIVGSANTMSQSFGNAYNGYQQNQLMNLIGKKIAGSISDDPLGSFGTSNGWW